MPFSTNLIRSSENAKKVATAEKSFGASLRRLRLQKGLNPSDFPGITEKEIGRIDRGEIKRPHARTVGKLAKRLNVKPEEIETY
jgi:transcriptional regulator with XRE-family HTH domain